MPVSMCGDMHMAHKRPEEMARGSGVRGNCEQLRVGAGDQLESSAELCELLPGSHLFSPGTAMNDSVSIITRIYI